MPELPGMVLRAYLAGGWVMHLITACSILALATIVQKALAFRRLRADRADLLAAVRKSLLNGEIGEAVRLCEESPGPTASVLRAGLQRAGTSREEVERAMEAAGAREIERLERFLGLLGTLVHLTPLLGLFGTVSGMIVAFDALYEHGLSDPPRIARGVSMALHTTAWGLAVAFVALPFHNFFASRVAREARRLEAAAQGLLDALAEVERLGTRG